MRTCIKQFVSDIYHSGHFPIFILHQKTKQQKKTKKKNKTKNKKTKTKKKKKKKKKQQQQSIHNNMHQ